MSDTRKTPKRKANGQPGPSLAMAGFLARLPPGWPGGVFFTVVLVLVAGMMGLSFTPGVRVFVEGEIATHHVTADQDLLVEDRESTLNKRNQVAQAQPAIFDLDPRASARLEERVGRIMDQVAAAEDEESQEQVRWQVSEELNSEASQRTFSLWLLPTVRNLILERVLPWLRERLDAGVVADSRLVRQYRQGVVVRDLGTGVETVRLDVAQIPDLPRIKEMLEGYLRDELNLRLRSRNAVFELLDPLMGPSLTLNVEATKARQDEVMASVEPVYYHIKKGEVIVRQGERVTAEDQLKLIALFSQEGRTFQYYRPIGVFVLSVLFAAGLIFTPFGRLFTPLPNKDALLLGLVTLAFAAAARALAYVEGPVAATAGFIPEGATALAFPVAGAVGLLALFFQPRICLSAGLIVSFLCCQMFGGGLDLFAFYFLGAMGNSLLIKRTQTRPEVLRSVFPLLILLFTAWAGTRLTYPENLSGPWVEAGFVLVGGFLSLMVVLALSPFVELVFGYTSRFRLMELMNLEQPLMQEMMVNAPGSYHHSLVVANMVEAGARRIGANSLLCKVAALYHDIGKLRNPQYFIENQMRGKNPHDKLAPSMSALILISHVKKGAELARKHKLGPEITDMIRQHHGNSVISFFFHKAQAQAKPGETVREEDYRYPGPRPQTREAGLVMLADAIEASSRTLQEPTPARIKAHIDTIIRRIFSEGQLDDSALTFKDLSAVGQTFHRILTGIFHQRIDYPGPAPARNDKAGREPKGQPARVTALPTGQAQQEREPDDRPDHGPEQGRDKAAR